MRLRRIKVEFYHPNKVEAVVFHDVPECTINCPGCYLKPHAEIWNGMDKWTQVGSAYLAARAYEYLASKQFECNQLIYAANTDHGLLSSLRKIGDNPTPGMEFHILANHKDWKKVVSDLLRDATNPHYTLYSRQKLHPAIRYAVSIDDSKTTFKHFPLWEQIGRLKNDDFDIINLLWTPKVAELHGNSGFHARKTKLYLVMHKPIHGNDPSPMQVLLGKKLLKYYDKVQKHHVQLDYCLNHLANGTGGCRAGINMFNIHASGMVTGCPYSARPKTWLQNHENVGEAIQYVRELANTGKDYDWNTCRLRNVSW
jgi:hypothetical protein